MPPSVLIQPEPVSLWTGYDTPDEGTVDMLERFYSRADQTTSLEFQLLVLASLTKRLNVARAAVEGGSTRMVIQERSLRVTRKVFVEGNEHLSALQRQLMAEALLETEEAIEKPTLSVFLYCDEDVLRQRWQARSRPGEAQAEYDAELTYAPPAFSHFSPPLK